MRVLNLFIGIIFLVYGLWSPLIVGAAPINWSSQSYETYACAALWLGCNDEETSYSPPLPLTSSASYYQDIAIYGNAYSEINDASTLHISVDTGPDGGSANARATYTGTFIANQPLLIFTYDLSVVSEQYNRGSLRVDDLTDSATIYNAITLQTGSNKIYIPIEEGHNIQVQTETYGSLGGNTTMTYDISTAPNGPSISAGYYHTLFIHPDGTLWAFGKNDQGQLGDGTTTDRLSPVQIGTDRDWRAVSAGWQHSLALKKDGTLWSWGDNAFGQLGDGTTTDRLIPVQIGGASDWIAVSAGGAHNLALKSNREMWGWGLNSKGQVGDGTTTMRTSPVQIGSGTDWAEISAGYEHSVAVKLDSSLYGWGWNVSGQVGDGTTTDRLSPVSIGTGFLDVSAGWMHSAAIKTGHALWSWGDNDFGQLGDGTTTDRHSPVQVGGSDWADVSAGGAHSLARKNDGSLHAWGLNSKGQVGDGTSTMRTAPVQIGSDVNWDEISAGYEHSAAKKTDISLHAWGWNLYGQLGDGTTTDQHAPALVDFMPVADLTGGPRAGCDSVLVNFTDLSSGGDGQLSYFWEFFGNWDVIISPATSTEQNPTANFMHYGGTASEVYASVRLTVTDADGDADVNEKTNYIYVGNRWPGLGGSGGCREVTPNFTATPLTGDAPLLVNFTNTSTSLEGPLTYEWDFDNDGVVDSTEENPSYTYSSVGTYSVKLTATDPYGRSDSTVRTDYILVKIATVPAADFTGTPTNGSNPLTVNFTNTTTGGEGPFTFEWDFDNDGTVDSTLENPSYVYTASGSYTITLKVTDTHGDTDTITKNDYIFVTTGSIPSGDFTGAPRAGCDSVLVNFTDLSSGGDGQLSYFWEFFGNWDVIISPATSTEQNPTANFMHYGGTASEVYASVRLTVTDADGDADVNEKTNYIYVGNLWPGLGGGGGCRVVTPAFAATPLAGDAPLLVNFTNTSTSLEGPLTYEWDFDNDGVVDSTEENPSYTYSSVGTYSVKLTATDPYGRSDSTVRTDYILVKIATVPAADFTGTPTSGSNPLTVNFSNATTGGEAPFTYEWDFDNDGTVDSNLENPSHIYTASGSYTVTLKVTDTHGDTDTVTKLDYISVTTSSVPIADFTGVPREGCFITTTSFTDLSSGGDGQLSYFWEFWGDSHIADVSPITSTDQNPTVSFMHYDGTYPYGLGSARLTVTDADGDTNTLLRSDYIIVGGYFNCNLGSYIAADFTASTTSGEVPLTVNFTNSSFANMPPMTYEWDFDNDGVVDSTEENPSHMYSAPGIYSVKLTATNSVGNSNTLTRENYITVNSNSAPTADFAGFPVYGCSNATFPTFQVNFTDLTTGGDLPFTYDWDFDYYNYNNDDGIDDSIAMHPVFDYYVTEGLSPVPFAVKLTVTDADGDSDTVIKNGYITGDPHWSCTMTCTTPPVLLSTSSGYDYHHSVQYAYDLAEDGQFMLVRDELVKEDLFIDINKTVTMNDGYDCGFNISTGKTVINGNIEISNGILVIGDGELEIL